MVDGCARAERCGGNKLLGNLVAVNCVNPSGARAVVRACSVRVRSLPQSYQPPEKSKSQNDGCKQWLKTVRRGGVKDGESVLLTAKTASGGFQAQRREGGA
jgi:hypothetical protein